MDKYSIYGECSKCGDSYMKCNPMVVCKDENKNEIQVCTKCYEYNYKNKFGNDDPTEDMFVK